MHSGEVWLINLDPTVGAEIRKTRPAVIVNDDAVGLLPLKVIVPVTEWKDRYSRVGCILCTILNDPK
jgi:mRNA interferase MazF